jgi:hypothetical protein
MPLQAYLWPARRARRSDRPKQQSRNDLEVEGVFFNSTTLAYGQRRSGYPLGQRQSARGDAALRVAIRGRLLLEQTSSGDDRIRR